MSFSSWTGKGITWLELLDGLAGRYNERIIETNSSEHNWQKKRSKRHNFLIANSEGLSFRVKPRSIFWRIFEQWNTDSNKVTFFFYINYFDEIRIICCFFLRAVNMLESWKHWRFWISSPKLIEDLAEVDFENCSEVYSYFDAKMLERTHWARPNENMASERTPLAEHTRISIRHHFQQFYISKIFPCFWQFSSQ